MNVAEFQILKMYCITVCTAVVLCISSPVASNNNEINN